MALLDSVTKFFNSFTACQNLKEEEEEEEEEEGEEEEDCQAHVQLEHVPQQCTSQSASSPASLMHKYERT